MSASAENEMGGSPKRRVEDITENVRKETLIKALEETVRITAWKRIRKYFFVGILIAVIITLIITLLVVVFVQEATRSSDKQHSRVVCQALQSFAAIETTAIQRQRAQTAGLEKQGFTFGIPLVQFKALVAKNEAQQKEQIKSLQNIQRLNCKDVTAMKSNKQSRSRTTKK